MVRDLVMRKKITTTVEMIPEIGITGPGYRPTQKRKQPAQEEQGQTAIHYFAENIFWLLHIPLPAVPYFRFIPITPKKNPASIN
jgi:hypothetical protein